MCAKPQVWNSGAAMCTRQPYLSGIRESSEIAASMPASLRGAPFGVPVVPEVRMMIRLWPPGTGSGLSSRSASISESRVSTSRLAVDPRQHPLLHLGLLEQAGELLVVDHDRGLLALEDVDQLRAGEGGVEVDQVRAELGRGDRGLDEAAVVAGHQSDRVTLGDPELLQRPGQRVRTQVHLAEGEVAALVDHPHPVGDQRGHREEAPGGAGAPLPERPTGLGQRQRRVGAEDPRLGQHLEAVTGRRGLAGQLVERGWQRERRHEVQDATPTGGADGGPVRRGSWERSAWWPTTPCSPPPWWSAPARRSARPRRCPRARRRWAGRPWA